MPTPKAIFFDLDDTLLAYSEAVGPCWQTVCQEFAPRVGGITPDALQAAIRRQGDWFWSDPERHRRGRLDLVAARREIIGTVLPQLGCTDPTLADEMSQRRSELHEQSVVLFPEAVNVLHALRSHGLRLALITNGADDAQTRKIDRFNLRPMFDSILIEGAFGSGKPDPRVFQHTLTALRVTPSEAWMVGDNLTMDIAPASRLGLFTVWHDFAGRGLPANAPVLPDATIRNISELLALPAFHTA